ncbi:MULTISPECIES: rhodanese-like domain-containing protein [Ramlibacter]|uniref:Sulfurtransferase n=1 Tax=Ramlibacter aquaticus TaxID=2780094 RepID=A0ABR9SI80_9BURK|nr:MULTISPECIES: rhodanese-like domain-containing protein [Ramlibacter]MBE7941737.1 sulfurtransferase [Ramlibacter aquaticus]
MVDQVRPAALADWLQQHTAGGPLPVVLDVREPVELRVAAVTPQGFELVHIPMNQLPARLGELDPARPVACLCHHGTRSQRVAQFLEAQGFADVVNIAGGIDLWSHERDPAVPRY